MRVGHHPMQVGVFTAAAMPQLPCRSAASPELVRAALDLVRLTGGAA